MASSEDHCYRGDTSLLASLQAIISTNKFDEAAELFSLLSSLLTSTHPSLVRPFPFNHGLQPTPIRSGAFGCNRSQKRPLFRFSNQKMQFSGFNAPLAPLWKFQPKPLPIMKLTQSFSLLFQIASRTLAEKYGLSDAELAIWSNGQDNRIKKVTLNWMKAVMDSVHSNEAQTVDLQPIAADFALLAHELPSAPLSTISPPPKKEATPKKGAKSRKEAQHGPNETDFANSHKMTSPECQRLNYELLAGISSYHGLILQYGRIMNVETRNEGVKGPQRNLALEVDSMLQSVLKEIENGEKIDFKAVIAHESRLIQAKDGISGIGAFRTSAAYSTLLKLQFESLLLQLNLIHLQFRCHLEFMLGRAKSTNPASLRHHFVHATLCLIVSSSKAIGMSELAQREATSQKSGSSTQSAHTARSSASDPHQRVLQDVTKLMKPTSPSVAIGSKAALNGTNSNSAQSQSFGSNTSKLPHEANITPKSMMHVLPTQLSKLLDSIRLLILSCDSGAFDSLKSNEAVNGPSYSQLKRLLSIEYSLCEDFIFFFSSLPHTPLSSAISAANPSHMDFSEHSTPSNTNQVLPDFEKGEKLPIALSALTSMHEGVSTLLDSFRSSIYAEKMGCTARARLLLETSNVHLSKLYLASPAHEYPLDRFEPTHNIARSCAALQYAQQLVKNRQNFNLALQVLHQLLAHKFQMPIVWNFIGIIEKWQGNLPKSLSSFKQSVAADSSFFPALYNLSRLYHYQQLYDTELRMLELLLPYLETREEDSDGNPVLASMLTTPLTSALVAWRLIMCYSNKTQFDQALLQLEKLENRLAWAPNGLPNASHGPSYSSSDHFILDCHPSLTKSCIRNEKARILLSMQDPARVLHLYGVSLAQNHTSINGASPTPTKTDQRGCLHGKSQNWETGHPDPTAILLTAEALLCSGKSSEAIRWFVFLGELFDEARKNREQSEIRVSDHSLNTSAQLTSGNVKYGSFTSSSSFMFKGHLITECLCGANSALFTKTAFGVDCYLLMHYDAVNNLAATYQCRQEYEKAMDMFAKARKIADYIATQNHAFNSRQSEITRAIAMDIDDEAIGKGHTPYLMANGSNNSRISTLEPGNEIVPHASVTNRLLTAHYNFCLLAFKLGKKEVASLDWVLFRFKIEHYPSLTSAEPLTSLKKKAEAALNQINKEIMVHDTIVMPQGEIPQWQLLQFDIHILSLAIHTHYSIMRV